MDKLIKSIKKSDNENPDTSETSLREDKVPFSMTCRPPSEFMVMNNKFTKRNNKITLLNKKLREINTEKIHCVKSARDSELLWSTFSRIWLEYGHISCISPYSVRMRENTDQNNSKYGHFLCSDSSEICLNWTTLLMENALNDTLCQNKLLHEKRKEKHPLDDILHLTERSSNLFNETSYISRWKLLINVNFTTSN